MSIPILFPWKVTNVPWEIVVARLWNGPFLGEIRLFLEGVGFISVIFASLKQVVTRIQEKGEASLR